MVVESPNCIWDYQGMVLRVDVPVQELVLVHVSVHKVLPCVHDEHGNQELDELDEDGRLCFGSPQVCLGCDLEISNQLDVVQSFEEVRCLLKIY